MQLSRDAENYLKNVFCTVPALSKGSAFSIIRFCSEHFHDSIKELCATLKVSRSGYYKWLSRRSKPEKHSELLQNIRIYQSLSNGTIGYRKMAQYLKLHRLADLSAISIYRLMKKYGLLSRSIRTKKAFLINRQIKPYSDLLQRNFDAPLPNQKWCIDITQINVSNGKLFLCAIIDLFDRSIVAYRISPRQNKSLVQNTLKQAFTHLTLNQRIPTILHSDQGYLFKLRTHKHLLNAHHVIPSMSRPGTPHDNAVIESFFSCIKTECIHLLPELKAKEMIAEIDRYITFYNHYRIHMKLGDMPINVRSKYLPAQNASSLGDTKHSRGNACCIQVLLIHKSRVYFFVGSTRTIKKSERFQRSDFGAGNRT